MNDRKGERMRETSSSSAGNCTASPKTIFNCSCNPGWSGVHCETQINYCQNVTCQNKGVCHPSLGDYTCQCLGSSYSGRHCEIISQTLATRQTTCKTFGYIAIIAIILVAIFVLLLDVLTYAFGVNATPIKVKRYLKKPWKRRRKSMPRSNRTNQGKSPSTVSWITVVESID
jgi:hypothetical protein